ncbi:MAG: MFS transporter [Simkaniaceae bacterium]|nr:MAG: MFS transporter [Simkaniaceae bacterium]
MLKKLSFYGLFVWSLASLFFLYEFFLQVFLSTISDQLMQSLNLDASEYSIMNAGYFLPYAIMQIPVGILVDRFGARRLLTIAISAAAVGVFWFSRTTTFEIGFISRFFMGFGSSFAYVSLLVLAMNWFPKKHFGLMVGLANFLGATGPFLAGGPLVLLLKLFNNDWRLILVCISILGVVLAICVGLFVRNGPGRKKGAVIHLDPYKEKLSVRMKLLIQNRQAWIIALFSALVYVSLPLLGAYWGTSYLQARGFSIAPAATLSSFLWVGYAIGSPLTGKVSDQIKRRKPILIFCSILGLLATLLLLFLPTNQFIFLSFIFLMIGLASSGSSIAFATISEHVQASLRATSIGFNNSVVMIFATILPPTVGFIIEIGAESSSHSYSVDNYENGLILMPVFYGISLILSTLFVKESFCRSQNEVIRLVPKKK